MVGNATSKRAQTVDFDRWFVPEDLTSLAHTPLYTQLAPSERLHYNQYYALYLNEQTAAFELVLTHFMRAVARLKWACPLRPQIEHLIVEELGHAHKFLEFNRRVRPDLYHETDRVFVRTRALFSSSLRFFLSYPALLPFPVWIILLLEERSLYYSARWAADPEIEPQFVELHRLHAQDEGSHVDLGAQLLQHLWEDRPLWLRRLNARLLTASLREFFFYPKRAALDIARLAFPGHPRLPDMLEQLRQLRYNRLFLSGLYSQTSNPLTLERCKRYPELLPLLTLFEGGRL